MKKGVGIAAVMSLAFAGAWLVGSWMAEPAFAAPGLPEAGVAAVSAQDHEFVGAREGCRRCHLKQYRSWEGTPHAKTLEVLEAEGEADNPECLACHTTGYGEPTGFVSAADTPELAAVTCEACHGPGADYRDREIMKDREASIAAGLRLPDESTCRGCHNDQSPTFPGTFDFEEMLAKGVHEIER